MFNIRALIGIGCASAANTHNNTNTNQQTNAIQQHNIDKIQNQNEIIPTEKIVQEEVKSENNKNEKNINNISQINYTIYKNKTTETINKNESNETKNSTPPLQTEDDYDEEEIHPGNGYTVEEIKEIRGYVKYYREHDYDIVRLYLKLYNVTKEKGKIRKRCRF